MLSSPEDSGQVRVKVTSVILLNPKISPSVIVSSTQFYFHIVYYQTILPKIPLMFPSCTSFEIRCCSSPIISTDSSTPISSTPPRNKSAYLLDDAQMKRISQEDLNKSIPIAAITSDEMMSTFKIVPDGTAGKPELSDMLVTKVDPNYKEPSWKTDRVGGSGGAPLKLLDEDEEFAYHNRVQVMLNKVRKNRKTSSKKARKQRVSLQEIQTRFGQSGEKEKDRSDTDNDAGYETN
jgi:hypothetical protein